MSDGHEIKCVRWVIQLPLHEPMIINLVGEKVTAHFLIRYNEVDSIIMLVIVLKILVIEF